MSLITAAVCSVSLLARADDVNERITNAGQVFQELVNADNGIPRDLLNKADCVIVLPSVKKGKFIIGGQYGKGVMSCRSGANFNLTGICKMLADNSAVPEKRRVDARNHGEESKSVLVWNLMITNRHSYQSRRALLNLNFRLNTKTLGIYLVSPLLFVK